MAIEVQNSMVERNAGLPPDRRVEFRIGIHLGDIVEESDGDQYKDRKGDRPHRSPDIIPARRRGD